MTREQSPNGRSERRRAARARELTIHAGALAAVMWAAVALDVVSAGPFGRYSRYRKGNDFVQFYVAGSLATRGAFGSLVDPKLFAQAQRPFMPGPDSAFPPVYGPHVALFFAPLSHLPYLGAYAAWAGLTVMLVAWAAAACLRRAPSLRPWPWAAVAITAAYPPFAYLVLAGQVSVLGLVSLACAMIALDRGSRVLAGAAIGLLGYKASLLVPAVAVCLLGGEPLLAAVAVGTATAQVLLLVPIVGMGTVCGFAANTIAFARHPDLLAKNLYLMASLRTFWEGLLPHPASAAAYVITGVTAVAIGASAWRRSFDPVLRVGVLGLAIVLAAPHLYFYDLILLLPAFVASASILVQERALALRWCTYLAFLSPLAAPIAAYTEVQFVTIVLAAWLVALFAASGTGQRHPESAMVSSGPEPG